MFVVYLVSSTAIEKFIILDSIQLLSLIMNINKFNASINLVYTAPPVISTGYHRLDIAIMIGFVFADGLCRIRNTNNS